MIWHYYLDQSMYLCNLENYCEKWGLELNLGKTNLKRLERVNLMPPVVFPKMCFSEKGWGPSFCDF